MLIKNCGFNQTQNDSQTLKYFFCEMLKGKTLPQRNVGKYLSVGRYLSLLSQLHNTNY